MPVTKTAKRALRSSARKAITNKLIIVRLEAAIRLAKKKKTRESVTKANSLTDRASKKHVIHKNKAARIKSALAKLVGPEKKAAKKASKPRAKKAAKKK